MRKDTRAEKVAEVLERGVEKIYPSFSLLKKKLLAGKPLKVYAGFDPTASSLHLGHLILLRKMAQFQALGHQVFFLIGDFTALIGDPSGRSVTRPRLTKKEVIANSRRFSRQAAKVLSFQGVNPAQLVFNSQWLGKLKAEELIKLASHFTVQQMLVRDMFQKRIEKKKPIFIHEFLYPLFQAYDSVALEADLEIGGNDQTFNMLCGRSLVKDLQHREKMVLTLKLLTDTQGKKMSKTASNAVFLSDSPQEMYGKVMSFPDELIEPSFYLATRVSRVEIEEIQRKMREKRVNRREAKARLAREIVTLCWGQGKAERSHQEFRHVFQEKSLPSKIPLVRLPKKSVSIIDLLLQAKLASSRTEARRLIAQGGIKIDQKVQTDADLVIKAKKGTLIQRGKRKLVQIQ